MNHGKLIDGKIIYAPTSIEIGGQIFPNPTDEMYLSKGWKIVAPVGNPPKSKKEGYHFERNGWQDQARAIVPTWKLVKDTKVLRTFSKLKVVSALKKENAWEQVKAFVEENDLYDLFLAAQDFSEGNEDFLRGKTALQSILGWSDEKVEEILSACII